MVAVGCVNTHAKKKNASLEEEAIFLLFALVLLMHNAL
jgi:hypothetical protein